MKSKLSRGMMVGSVMISILLFSVVGCSPPGSLNSGDFLGLEDWERDLLFAGLALVPSPAGEANLFTVWVTDFFGADPGTFPYGEGGAVHLTEPVLGRLPLDPDNNVSFRVAIPDTYNGTNAVSMRLYLERVGVQGAAPAPVAGNLVFTVTVRRFVDGAAAPDSYIATPTFTADVAASTTEFKVLTMPLTVAVPGGLGGGALAVGDYLAFELECTGADGDEYLVLAAEFFESSTAPAVAGGIIS